jgi:signal transduction histidine kinase
MTSLVHSLSIRWRLALLTAGLTLVVLCAFAAVIGQLTINRVRSDFRREMSTAVDNLGATLSIRYTNGLPSIAPNLVATYAASNRAVIRVVFPDGGVLAATDNAPNFERLGLPVGRSGTVDHYRVQQRATTLTNVRGGSTFGLSVIVQYARRTEPVEATVRRVRIFLLFGTLGGAAAALALALALSRRALAPISRLTSTARDIGATRDPSQRVPVPDTEDEVAELAETMDQMLQALEESRTEREELLTRQRQFVADASHELRTPLTSVLANLELLAEVLDGERGEAARSALRSTQRMRRLVGDLLLLARADAQRHVPHEPLDLAQVLVDAAAELQPVIGDHELTVDARPACVDGARDELHRLALNLMQNAVQHTPAGTRIHASVATFGDMVHLIVADDGPGVPEGLRDRVFDRFARADGDRGGSVGLGLSIVRAVSRTHGGDVELICPADGGAIFEVRLPALQPVEPATTAIPLSASAPPTS